MYEHVAHLMLNWSGLSCSGSILSCLVMF